MLEYHKLGGENFYKHLGINTEIKNRRSTDDYYFIGSMNDNEFRKCVGPSKKIKH